MSMAPPRPARLHQFYLRYLEDENAARFVRDVAESYLPATLERLAASARRISRRSAVLALGLLGDMRCNPILGRSLRDPDRGVRMLAENAIQDIWMRVGDETLELRLRRIARLNTAGDADRAARDAGQLIELAPTIAEAWNQRAIAWFQLEKFVWSARDCRQTLRLNPFHFGAAVGMGHCQLEFHDPAAALKSLTRSLEIFPDMDNVRAQVRYLQRALNG